MQGWYTNFFQLRVNYKSCDLKVKAKTFNLTLSVHPDKCEHAFKNDPLEGKCLSYVSYIFRTSSSSNLLGPGGMPSPNTHRVSAMSFTNLAMERVDSSRGATGGNDDDR